MSSASGKKRKSTGEKPVFKHIKAKVGKRAVRPANETDTDFKTASIHVGSQTVERSKSDVNTELFSTRGRSLPELIVQLRHPAANMRLSAAKGIHDIVLRKDIYSSQLQSQLALLIPAYAKSLVDEDSSIRTLAAQILEDTIQRACLLRSQGKRDTSTSSTLMLRPFMPLLMAHVTSILNSLDRQTQMDGAKIVGMLSSRIPALMQDYVTTILPCYVLLLSHRFSHSSSASTSRSQTQTEQGGTGGGGGGGGGGDKRNRSKKMGQQSKSSTGDKLVVYPILASLHSLLQTTTVDTASTYIEKSELRRGADLVVVPGGRSINAVVLAKTRQLQAHSIIPFQRIEDLSLVFRAKGGDIDFQQDPSVESTPLVFSSGNSEKVDLSFEKIDELLSKLRDWFTEIMQQSQEKRDLQEILFLIQNCRLFWNSFGKEACVDSEPKKKKLVHTCLTLTSLMQESFPMLVSDVLNADNYLLQQTNLEMCAMLFDTYTVVRHDKRTMKECLAYLFSQLSKAGTQSTLEQPDSNSIGISAVSANETLSVLAKVLKIWQNDPSTISKALPKEILHTLADTYFSADMTPVADSHQDSNNSFVSLARSSGARQSMMLFLDVIMFFECDVTTLLSMQPFEGLLLRIVQQQMMPYLLAWQSDFLEDSHTCFAVLLKIIRQLDIEQLFCPTEQMQDEEQQQQLLLSKQRSVEFVTDLRKQLVCLLKPSNQTKKATSEGGSEGFIATTIFEAYPAPLKHQVLSLVVMLQGPNDELLDLLSNICARGYYLSALSKGSSSYTSSRILQSIHSVRKTISLQAYLTFVSNCTGLTRKKWMTQSMKKKFVDYDSEMLRYDEGIAVAGKCLVLCRSPMVMTMLCPLLKSWLDKRKIIGSKNMKKKEACSSIILIRAALSWLGTLLEDAQNEVPMELEETTISSIIFLFQRLENGNEASAIVDPSEGGEREDNNQSLVERSKDTKKQIVIPVVRLLQTAPASLLRKVYGSIATRIQRMESSEQANCVVALILLMEEFDQILTRLVDSEFILEKMQPILEALVGGPSERLGDKLKALVNVHATPKQ